MKFLNWVVFIVCCWSSTWSRAQETVMDSSIPSASGNPPVVTTKDTALSTAEPDVSLDMGTSASVDPLSSVVRSGSVEEEESVSEPEEEGEPMELQDLRPAVKLPHTWVFYTVWGLIGLLLLVLLVMARRACRSRPIPVVVLSPYEQAIQDLEAAQSLMYHKDVKPFIIAITDAVRVFFSRGFSLPAPECTTEELLEQLEEVKILSQETKEEIAVFLKQCDMVKFTKQRAENIDGNQLYSQARHIVEVADRVLQPPNTTTQEGEFDAKFHI